MSRLEKINELLRSELAVQITNNIHLDNGLITLTRVKCSPTLRAATVYFSVLPENKTGSALKLLRKNNSYFSQELKKLNLKYIPKLSWRLDPIARHAAEMDRSFNDLS